MTLQNRLKTKLQKTPMPLSDYMAMCLYDPKAGYYTTKIPIGTAGDFTTAPEISQLFGEMMAVWALDQTQGKPHNLIEFGPGKGTLLSDISRISEKYDLFNYFCIETSPKLTTLQKDKLKGLNCIWGHDLNELQPHLSTKPCLFIANELLDALPIDQYVFTQNQWHKRHVVLDNKDNFVYKDILVDTPPAILLDKYKPPIEGDILEYSKDQDMLMNTLTDHIKEQGGALLFVDYGYGRYIYGDTFQALRKHQPVSPLNFQGQADLTSHVNFAYYVNQAESKGLQVHLYTQADFLKMMGVDLRCQILCKQFPEKEKIIREGLDRLINKMGYLFKVMVVKKYEKSTQ